MTLWWRLGKNGCLNLPSLVLKHFLYSFDLTLCTIARTAFRSLTLARIASRQGLHAHSLVYPSKIGKFLVPCNIHPLTVIKTLVIAIALRQRHLNNLRSLALVVAMPSRLVAAGQLSDAASYELPLIPRSFAMPRMTPSWAGAFPAPWRCINLRAVSLQNILLLSCPDGQCAYRALSEILSFDSEGVVVTSAVILPRDR